MDFQTMISNQVAVDRAAKMSQSPVLTVGELILLLEPIVARQAVVIEKYKHEATVEFDFEYAHPTYLESWRGVYAELAFGFSFEGDAPTVSKVLKQLKESIGKTFTGWKGGDFVMGKHTPVWVANSGNTGRTGIVGVIDEEYGVILETKYIQD